MESGRQQVRKVTRAADSCEPTTTTTTTTNLLRWSSEPASLSSGGSGDMSTGLDLLDRTRQSVAVLQALAAAQLNREASQTSSTANTGETVHCVEQDRSESRHLRATVVRQHRTIAKLRRQLRDRQLRPSAASDVSSVSSDDLDDKDDSLSDSDVVSVQPECSDNCAFNNSHRKAMCLQSDSTVLARQQACVLHDHSGCQSNPFVEPSQHLNQCDKVAAASCDVTVTLGGLGGPHAGTCSGSDHVTEQQQQNQSADDETTETLRRRLRDTVETCQRLATALDARHASSTTHDDSQTLPAAKHTMAADQQETNNCLELLTAYEVQLSEVESRLKEVEEMNARWQGYVELREKYICALEQRCSDLKHHQRQQLTEEQQRQIDELLLQQHRKTELAVEARLKAEAENRRLRTEVKQLTTIREQNKVCISQLLVRLQEAETARRSEQSTVNALRQQVNAYREDFESERLDRHRAQERVVNLERQLASLKYQFVGQESSGAVIRSSAQRSRSWQEMLGDSDCSLPQLIARGDETTTSNVDTSSPPFHRHPRSNTAPNSF